MAAKDKRILLVDDEPGIRRILRLFLEVEGFDIVEASDANETYQSIAEKKPDIIVLDVILNGATGFEICKKLKDDPATKDIIIFLFTALSSDADVEQGQRAGANLYLMKPLNPREIVERIKEAIK